MDSIYVEGEEAPTVYRGQIGAKDTPYYRKGGYAQVDIQRSWLGEEELVLTVYYTKFNRDGSMTKEQQDITVALFKKSFFAKMWVGFSNWLHEDFINGLLFHIGVMVLLSLLVLGIVKHVRSKNGIVQAPSPKENNKIVEALERDNMQLKQRLMSKEKALADCEARLQNKIKEIDKLKTLTEVNIDKNLFVNKCNSLNDEIEKIRKELMDNPRMDSEKLREKLLTLEKIVEIKKSSNYKQ